MDFVKGFPKVGGKSVILTVVNRLSKYTHFIALGHPYSATDTQLRTSSTFHPQTDEQSEVMNRIITVYLRCLADDHPRR
jgi:hypothetical protein